MDKAPIQMALYAGFKTAWRSCTNETAIRHLDVDAPRLFQGLYEQELSGEYSVLLKT